MQKRVSARERREVEEEKRGERRAGKSRQAGRWRPEANAHRKHTRT